MEKDIKDLLMAAQERSLTPAELVAWRNHYHNLYVKAHKWLQVARAHEHAYRGYVIRRYKPQPPDPSTPVSNDP